MTTPKHCPGFEQFKDLESFMCRCTNCGAQKELFSDEFTQQHLCKKCQMPIDFNKCELYASGEGNTTR